MNENIEMNTRVRRLFHYLEDFEKGNIQVPPFQRDFVWTNTQKLELLDSIKRGYPIGSILFWRPDNSLESDLSDLELQTIGAYKLPKRKLDFFYILDGYHRLSTLFGCLVNPATTNLKRDEKEWFKYFNIIYNLEEDRFELNRKTLNLKIYEVPIYKFIDGGEFYIFKTELVKQNISEEKANKYLEKYKKFGAKITTYDIPSIDLIGGNLKMAVEIFSRLNSRGQQVSDDWKVSALSYDKESGFRLGTEIDKLFDSLKKYNFFTQKKDRTNKRKIILQSITNSFGDIYFDTIKKNDQSTLEKLAERNDFESSTHETFKAIKRTSKFLFKKLYVLNSKLIPYNSQFIFITDFFNKLEKPSKTHLKKLKVWFWITTYSNYFTRYNLSKQRIAYEKFQAFIDDESQSPVFYDRDDPFDALEFPDKITMGSVRAKALALFMLNYQMKKSDTNKGLLKSYKIYKLFKSMPSNSENTILIINDENEPNSQRKDLSHWLYSDEDYSKFFITEAMKGKLNDEIPPLKVLELRRKLIIQKEKEFVESFDIKYR